VKLGDLNIKDKMNGYRVEDLVPLECNTCNKTFSRKKRNIYRGLNKGNTKAFCSKECNRESQNTSIKTTCANCFKEVIRTKNQFEKSKRHFCGHSCRASFNNRGVRRHGNREYDNCFNCGINIIGKSKKYCSRKCF
jgi:hypothetical protein